MSLTSFIKIPEVSAKFRSDFKLPSVKLEGEIKAPPVTTNYALMGTAFDYLMRFYLERINKNAIADHWVAENSVAMLNAMSQVAKKKSKTPENLLPAKQKIMEEFRDVSSQIIAASNKMNELIDDAKKTHGVYLKI